MQVLDFKLAASRFEELCDRACNDHEPCVVHRADNRDVVVMSLEDFNSWQETRYLMSNPHNAKHLLDSLAEARAGKVAVHSLIEE
jgi:antitoxin YefM